MAKLNRNIFDYYIYKKNELGRKRGVIPVGPPKWSTGQYVPKATWGDVMSVYADLTKKAKPLPEAFTGWLGEDPPANYKRAKKEFELNSPYAKSVELFGITQATLKFLAAKNTTYPFNADFWWYAKNFALYRNSLGAIQPWTERLTEATKESATDAYRAAKENTPSFFGMVGDFATIIKWGTIAGLSVAGYWYVIRPMAAKRKQLKGL